MKVNFNVYNCISNIKTFKRVNVSVPTFKSQLSSDIFVRTTQIDDKKENKSILPKYLYHLTNQKCYKAIMRSGKIKPSKDTIDGVYMFDMKDFQNNWRTNSNYHKSRVLAEDLIDQAIKRENGLVLLRIPTENLNIENFTIRPQDELNSYLRGEHFTSLKQKYRNYDEVLKHKDELPDYIREGYNPQNAREFCDNGRAIEYIYRDSIDIDKNNVQMIYELPDVNYKTFLGYGIKHFAELFDNLKNASENA